MLYDEIKLAAKSQKSNDSFVFPEQARMYLENPDGITWRVKKVLAAAGFRDEEEPLQTDNKNNEKQQSATLPLPSPKCSNGDIIRGEIHVARKEGLRRASVRDFHSFRVTWVTLALTAGVPLVGYTDDVHSHKFIETGEVGASFPWARKTQKGLPLFPRIEKAK